MDSIYLDHNATTPIHPKVVDAMVRCHSEIYGNPASQHRPGQRAKAVLEDAREKIAEILGADLSPPRRDRVIFTSGGTEANNLAVLGIALAAGVIPGRIVISAGEHQSIIGPAEHLLERGWQLDTLGLSPQGVVRVERLGPLLAEETRLASVLMGNHETGVLQPVGELASICTRAGIPLHTDAVQVVGKMPVNFRELGVAAMTVSAHKFRGPVGIGALVVQGDIPVAPLLFGGHQQLGLRPGTEPVALAVGMAAALGKHRREHGQQQAKRLRSLRDRFEGELQAALPGVVVHGAAAARLPQTTSVAFPGLDAEVLRIALDLAGVACSVGSACSSGAAELSPTLRAMELPNDLVASSLRFSLGDMTTEAEIDEAVRRISVVCGQLHPSQQKVGE